jgi:hypothetical protein
MSSRFARPLPELIAPAQQSLPRALLTIKQRYTSSGGMSCACLRLQLVPWRSISHVVQH